MRLKTELFSRLALLFGLGSLIFFAGPVYSQAPYYQSKTITILRGGEPGGSGDMQGARTDTAS
jgi:hypothetical protein